MNSESKHREVSRQLLSDIAAGKYGVSGRLPGEDQLARKFGVSRTTIGRALRDLQAEGVIERRAAREHVCQPAGRSSASGAIPERATTKSLRISA
jgi:DNA-binding FadR family transcriptional regulator